MLLNQAQLDQFHLNGFVLGAKFLDSHVIERLRDELDAVLTGTSRTAPVLNRNLVGVANNRFCGAAAPGQKGREVRQIVNMWEASSVYRELTEHPELTATVARLCNNTDTLRVWHDQIQYKPPQNGGATDWHQDYPAWPILVPADLVSAWIALDDADEQNGCMWMVPGSHRWGQVPIRGDENFQPSFDPSSIPDGVAAKAVPVPVKAGQVAFHHCMTWHGSPCNLSDRPRRAFAIHYMPGYTIYRPQGGHVMEKHVTVAPGEVLAGPAFPVVYQRMQRMAATQPAGGSAAY